MLINITKTGAIQIYPTGSDNMIQVSKSHPKYKEIREKLLADDEKAAIDLINLVIQKKIVAPDEAVLSVSDEVIEFEGRVIHDKKLAAIVKRFASLGDPVKRFVRRMFCNPQWSSVEQLVSFLSHGHFALTEDGCFLAYKGVTEDYYDCRTLSFDNHPGSHNAMPRSEVTFDPHVPCSFGFHVGTHSYASTYGSRVVLVRVDPAHCVSVPVDENCQKLRVSEYWVVADCVSPLDDMHVYDLDGTCSYFKDFYADCVEENGSFKDPKHQAYLDEGGWDDEEDEDWDEEYAEDDEDEENDE
jgi:hypothetical protein